MSKAIQHTDDGRYLIVNGRKWRATNPHVPASLRTELVAELMAARRAVKHAKGDEGATASARERVGDAKTALGERGEPWWEPATDEGVRTHIRAAIHALLRARDRSSSICASEAARIVASPDWHRVMDTVHSVAAAMAAEGLIEATHKGQGAEHPACAEGSLRYRRVAGAPTSSAQGPLGV